MTDEVQDKKIREWAAIFGNIYRNTDKQRTPEQIWIAIMAHASSMGESIRTISFETLLNSAAHTFCWLCSFVNMCNSLENDAFSLKESLCGIVSLKYPGVCGHCEEKHCTCDPVKMDSETNKSAKYKTLPEKYRPHALPAFEDYHIEGLISNFDIIYAGRIHILTLESIGFHFLEEVGEAAVAVRKLGQLRKIHKYRKEDFDPSFLNSLENIPGIVAQYEKYIGNKKPKDIIDYASSDIEMLKLRLVDAKMELIIEIADTISWFCAVLNKLTRISRSIWENPSHIIPKLEVKLNEMYVKDGKTQCPTCKHAECACVFYSE